MKTVSYLGYQASVEFEDGTLFVKVLHISDLIVGECDKASDVDATARALIDDYIATCAEIGKNPEPPFKGSFNVRMTPELHRKASVAAAEEGMSLNAWICSSVNEKLDCNRLDDRFDGVINRRENSLRILQTIRSLQHDSPFVDANTHRHVKVTDVSSSELQSIQFGIRSNPETEKRWSRVN